MSPPTRPEPPLQLVRSRCGGFSKIDPFHSLTVGLCVPRAMETWRWAMARPGGLRPPAGQTMVLERRASAALLVLVLLAAFPSALSATAGREVRCRDSADCTADLQAAIGAGGDIVLTPGVWTVEPIFFTSNHQTVSFGPDVEVIAKRGCFHGGPHEAHPVLFTANGTRNLTVLGDGTRWRMQKADYINPLLYNHSEYRAGLSLIGCDGCRVQDVTISDTGGDGVYVDNNYGGRGDTYANDIELLRIRTQNAFRNGLSVIRYISGLSRF